MALPRWIACLAALAVFQPAAFGADDSFAARFANPPAEGRILKIIHGWPDRPEARQALVETLSRQGFGGVVCNVAFHNGYVESAPNWAAFLDGVRRARAAGWSLWLYDERGYPSGNAGGIVLRDHPDWQSRGLLVADTSTRGTPVDLKAPPGKVVLAAAFPTREKGLDRSGQVDLSGQVRDGRLRWTPPAGSGSNPWRVLLVTEDALYEGTHAAANVFEHVPYVDLLRPEMTAYFLKVTHDRYAEHLGKDLGKTFVATFTDEPSLMSHFFQPMPYRVLPWSPGLPGAFRTRRGYELAPVLPDLIAGAGPEAGKHRHDYWLTVAELVSEGFFGQIQAWCHAHGLRSGGHLLMEESLTSHVPLYGDFFRCARRLDAPSVDCLTSIPAEVPWWIGRLLASAGELEGKTLVMSETSDHSQHYRPPGDRRPVHHVTEEEIRGTLNRQMVGGVNRFTSYYSFAGLSDEALVRLNKHVGRSTLLLTGGHQVADVAVVYPIESLWTRFVPSRSSTRDATEAHAVESLYQNTLNSLYEARRDLTVVDARALAEASVEGDTLVHGRLRWRVVVLPGVDTLPERAWQNLARFVKAGGVVAALSALPTNSTTSFPSPAVQSLARELFGDAAGEPRTVTFPSGGATLFLPNGSESLLTLALQGIIAPDVSTADRRAPLRATHRQVDGREVYFLINDSGRPWAGDVELAAAGPAELLDPATGSVRPYDPSKPLRLELEPYGARLVRCASARTPRRFPIQGGALPNLSFRDLPASKPTAHPGEFVRAGLTPTTIPGEPAPAWEAKAQLTKGHVDTFLFAEFPYAPPADLSGAEAVVLDSWVPEGQATSNSLLVILHEDTGADYLASTGRSLGRPGHERSVLPLSRFQLAGWSHDSDGRLNPARISAVRVGWGGYLGSEGETVNVSFSAPRAACLEPSPSR